MAKKIIGFHEQGEREKKRKIRRAIAKAMKSTGHSYREISEILDLSVSTVHAMVRQGGQELDRLSGEILAREGKRHRMLSEYILTQISDRDISRASLKEKIIASAILTDKAVMIDRMQRRHGEKTEQTPEHEAAEITLEYQELAEEMNP